MKDDRLKGLTRKERFEALGMDETWTEYNALLMNRPSPGIYITPQGKRRPAGKRQGRPRISRIAVFKSPELRDLPWFVKDQSGSDDEESTLIAEATKEIEEPSNIQSAGDIQSTPTPQVSKKRPHVDTPFSDLNPSKRKRGRPRKNARPEETDDAADPAVSSEVDAALTVSDPPALEVDANSAQIDVATKHALSAGDTQTPSNKRQRIESPERAASGNVSHSSTPVNSNVLVGQTTMGPPSKTATPRSTDVSGRGGLKEKRAHLKRTPERGGGSVNLLRRKIVMEIVEKAGGAYPSGHEIWYPFVTEWMKLFKEKPDTRTVKTAIKNLVDSGKLRQLTFSGKDTSGVMVTKTIITKPEIRPDDPLVKEMQEKVLATDRAHPKVSYSPNIVLDPSVSKHSSRPSGQKSELPVLPGARFRLQSKPASVVASEKRRDRQVEKALYKRVVGAIDFEDEDNLDTSESYEGAVRLLRIKRPPPVEEFGPGSHTTHTLIFRPNASSSVRHQQGGERKSEKKRIVKRISSLGPYTMLMNAQQTFHPGTGTFATQSTLSRIRRLPGRSHVNVADSIHELSQLATAAPGKDFHRTSDKISKWEIGHEEMLGAAITGQPYISQTVRDSFQSAPIDGEIRFDIDEPAPAPRPVTAPMKTRKRTEKKQPRQQPERRLETVDPSTQGRARFQPIFPAAPRPTKRRTFQPIPEALLRKIMLAIVVVRVLTGGSEARHVDWDLVAACFPGHDAPSLIDRARNVLNRNRLQIIKMQQDFQYRFLEAYAKDQVPSIDYEDLDHYPWPRLIEWANFQLEVSTSERAPSLPATREQFDGIFELREEPTPTADEIFTTTSGMTVNYRRGVMAQTPFAVMLDNDEDAKESQLQKSLKWQEVTKSFVRANIVTPEDAHDTAKSKTILERFGDKRIESAVESLVKDRVIGLGNRGRVAPGRNYDITDHLLQQLNRRRLIECGILRNAAQFKVSTLDPKMKNEATAEVQYNAEDGHILATINLFADGHVQLFPRGAPRDKFGLVDDGYLTRQMDKTKLRFAIDVHPTKSYVYGNPVTERAASTIPPSLSPPEDDVPQKIPLWMDLNGHLVEPLWEMSIASVLGCMALREGLSAKGISSMIKPAMAPWEIETLIGWLVDVGIAQEVVSGQEKRWKVKEWWWMVLS